MLLFSVHEFLIIFIFITFRCIYNKQNVLAAMSLLCIIIYLYLKPIICTCTCVRCTFNSFIWGVQNFRICAIFRALDCWMDEVHVVHSCWFRGQSPLHLWCTMIFCYCKVACVTVFLLFRDWTKMVNELLLFSWVETFYLHTFHQVLEIFWENFPQSVHYIGNFSNPPELRNSTQKFLPEQIPIWSVELMAWLQECSIKWLITILWRKCLFYYMHFSLPCLSSTSYS